jgi:pimeloyl-ACP methyl ester carboxylesterase
MHSPALGLILLAAGAAGAATLYADQLPFAKAQRLVDIGGRRLNLYCSGDGPVTVVFSAASGDAGWSWYQVQPEVAKRTRACVYDRAGQGFSDPSPLPPTFGNTVDDLHALLGKAGVKPPYVMVGVSYGGAVAQLYAWRHPLDVKGLVLLEPHHEDEADRLDKAAQGKLKQAGR